MTGPGSEFLRIPLRTFPTKRSIDRGLAQTSEHLQLVSNNSRSPVVRSIFSKGRLATRTARRPRAAESKPVHPAQEWLRRHVAGGGQDDEKVDGRGIGD